ncbi:hypothetical protein P1O40_19880, partial [Bacillus velezensis]|nr:hypothetical protein [Bacillus velezensis]MDF3270246.1 hypothetical protein [Bacillus velezensis]
IDEVVISKESLVIKFNITIEKALEGAYYSDNKGRVNDPIPTGTDSNAHHFLSNLNLTDLLSSLETNKSIQFNHEVKRRS